MDEGIEKKSRKLPWWTWIVPGVVSFLGTLLSFQFRIAPGTAVFYLPIPLGVAMMHWWGPRVLLGVYVNALCCAGYWELQRRYLYPVYAVPEVLEVAACYYFFTLLAKGRSWIPDLRDLSRYCLMGVLIPSSIFDFLTTFQLYLLGDIEGSSLGRVMLCGWIGDVLSLCVLTAPLLMGFTAPLEKRGWSITRGATRFPDWSVAYWSRSALVRFILTLVVCVLLVRTLPVTQFWFVYGVFPLWAALTGGIAPASIIALWISALVLTTHRQPAESMELFAVHTNLTLLGVCGLFVGMAINALRSEIAEKENAQQKLLQAQKLEALGTLVSGIAHDFNNLLAAILGFLETARQDIEFREDPVPALQGAERVVLRAKSLVQNLLTFSRQGKVELQSTDLKELFKEAFFLIRASIPKTMDIVVLPFEGEVQVSVDPTQIQQVLLNLAVNAWHASGEYGRIEVRLLDAQRGAARIEFRDFGTGIAPEILPRIFDPFFTTKGPGKGTGLGLSQVLGIVQAHHGKISVSSVAGGGTSFVIELPCRVDTSSKPRPFVPGRMVLHIDDEPDLLETTRHLLEGLGCQVDSFQDPIRALEVIGARRTHYDLIITDQIMPRMGGLFLAARLREIYPQTPVVLATGLVDSGVRKESTAHHIAEILEKPYRVTDLKMMLNRLI